MLNRKQSRSTGTERDSETGLDYFGARYYGSNMGRFTSPDPLSNSAGCPVLASPGRGCCFYSLIVGLSFFGLPDLQFSACPSGHAPNWTPF
ncbi:MAG: RHS repeat-associated core domain-containing protein [Terriglobia bacterium]|nr:RHS repeat-associated core domain-containing protein [Terriglobia bacterium]